MATPKASLALSLSTLSLIAWTSCFDPSKPPQSSDGAGEDDSDSESGGSSDGTDASEGSTEGSAGAESEESSTDGGETTAATEESTSGATGTAETTTGDPDAGETVVDTSFEEPETGTTEASDGGGTDSNDDSSDDPKSKFHIYLALGQSNMQGAAHLPDEPISHPRVRVLQGQNCQEHSIPYGEWRDHFQPVIRCQEGERPKPDGSTGPIGLSPVDTFAIEMAEAAGPDVTIGLVGAAYGGTDIQAHLPNCADHGACTPPFGDVSGAPIVGGTTPIYPWILDLAQKAQEVGVIKGIIIHHGENNSGQEQWLTYLDEYITALRSDLGLDPSEVPLIAGELPQTGCCTAHNALVRRVPDYVENGHWVSSGPMEDGTVLGDRSDGLHWSTFSVIEMGKRYAAKMLEVGN